MNMLNIVVHACSVNSAFLLLILCVCVCFCIMCIIHSDLNWSSFIFLLMLRHFSKSSRYLWPLTSLSDGDTQLYSLGTSLSSELLLCLVVMKPSGQVQFQRLHCLSCVSNEKRHYILCLETRDGHCLLHCCLYEMPPWCVLSDIFPSPIYPPLINCTAKMVVLL